MSTYTLKIWLCSVPDELPRLPSLVGASLAVSEIETHGTDTLPSKILVTAPSVCASLTVTASGEVTDNTRNTVKKYAAALCDEFGGFTEDEDGTLGAPTRSFGFPAINLYTEMLTLALWYAPTLGFDALAEDFVSALEDELPCALPITYGEDTPYSRDGFIEYLKAESTPVWLPAHPVASVGISDAARRESDYEGYRASRIAIELPAEVYEREEWAIALRRLLCRLCDLTGAFFGQITLGEPPVSAWWWQGVPAELGVACYFGEPYSALIPDCESIGTPTERGYLFVEPDGPRVPDELISFKKSRLRRKNTDYPYYDNFTVAKSIPLK